MRPSAHCPRDDRESLSAYFPAAPLRCPVRSFSAGSSMCRDSAVWSVPGSRCRLGSNPRVLAGARDGKICH